MDDDTIGFFLGIVLTVMVWTIVCGFVESAKVRDGYLTYENKRYQVVLYDELETPPKPEKQ